ncbi:hypothetical protein [Paraburkholderia megapolitana]|uniref:hypothetical protein n=1 Tax=Paraburkholderia megapolitana TaxID=420953 RepID=UPI0038BC213B
MRENIRSAIFCVFGLVAAPLLDVTTAHAGDNENEAHAIPFLQVAASAAPDREWQQKVCQLASAACSPAGDQNNENPAPALYRAKGDEPGNYYAILPGPQLLKVSFTSTAGWSVLQQWNFSDYTPANRVEGDGEAPPLEIYPALYPLGSGRSAVAVLAGWHEMYSGGDGSWENADFVELGQNGQHASVPRVSKLPFSCSKSIRACFSDSDYKHSVHCTEDFDGSLRLKFVQGASAGKLDWIATWKESRWPGMKPQTQTQYTSVSVTLPANQNPVAAGESLQKKVPFCEPVN